MECRDEIIRWANSPDGTKVWKYFPIPNKEWMLVQNPFTDSHSLYIVDDEEAEMRKELIDKTVREDTP